jgi:glycosyltransferase involved in cell wall biosynthesis
VIGHLANLCEEKGVDDFIALCRELKTRNIEFIGKIAGPFSNKTSEILVNASLDEFDEIEYCGGLYGADKDSFFKSLDAFVFPSKYKNEAEPLVLYEAGQYGVLNIGSRRGCMEDVIHDLEGISIEEGPLMVSSMADTLQLQYNSGNFSAQARSARINAFATAQLKAKSVLENLFQDIVGK